MNTIQKLVTIGEENTLVWHQKGVWVSDSGNVITMDPDKGIDRNGVPIGGGGEIPPVLTPEKIDMEDGLKKVVITADSGVVVTGGSGGSSTTMKGDGVTIASSGGSSTLTGSLLSMIQGTHNTATGNIVLGETKSLLIGNQSLTRDKLVSLSVVLPSNVEDLQSRVGVLELDIGMVQQLRDSVADLEEKDVLHESRLGVLEASSSVTNTRLSAVDAELDSEIMARLDLSQRVDDNEAVANAGISTLANRASALEEDVRLINGRLIVSEDRVEDAITSADAANRAADRAQDTADVAQSTAESAQSTATAAQSTATAAQSTATAAQSTATAAQSTATAAQSTSEEALSMAFVAKNTADSANSAAYSAQVFATIAKDAADEAVRDASAAQLAAASAQSAATSAQSTATSAQSVATAAQSTADVAQSDIVTLKSVNTAFDGRITALETGAGGEPVVLPFYAKTSMIDFGTGNTNIGNNTITLGASSSITLGTGGVSLRSSGALNLGVSGSLNLGSAILTGDGVNACNRLANIAGIDTSEDSRVMLYTPSGSGSVDYSNIPVTSFQNPSWVTVDGPTFEDTTLRKSILTLDGVSLTRTGIEAAMDLGSNTQTQFVPGMFITTRDSTTGQLLTSRLPTYITSTGITFGVNTIGSEQTAALANLSALSADESSTNYVSYNNVTKLYSYQAKPSFINTTNNTVGNMGGTSSAAESYLTSKGLAFGSGTIFDPTENTCYGNTAVTVVDRTSGTPGFRKRAEFGANGIVLSNPLATSIDDPASITLNRSKLSLLQRISAVDVISSPDVAPTSTKRILVGDKVTGQYSYALAPALPDYLKTNSLVMGSDTGDITITKTAILAGIANTLTSAGLKCVLGSTTATVSSTIEVANGSGSIKTLPNAIAFTVDSNSVELTKADVDFVKTNLVNAVNVSRIEDVDPTGNIHFLASPTTAGLPKKYLAVPKTYSWLKDLGITATGTIDGKPRSFTLNHNGLFVSDSNAATTLTPYSLSAVNNLYRIDYGPEAISSSLFGQTDLVYGAGVLSMRHRGIGAANALGIEASTPYNNIGVNYLTVAKNESTKVQYKYMKVSEVIPMIRGATIEPKLDPNAIIDPSIGTDALPAVLDAGGLTFLESHNTLPENATRAPHNFTTYNSNFMRVGSAMVNEDRTVVSKDGVVVNGGNNMGTTSISSNRVGITNRGSTTSIGGGFISVASNNNLDDSSISVSRQGVITSVLPGSLSIEGIASGEFAGESSIRGDGLRMIDSIRTPMSGLLDGRYNMIIESNSNVKSFVYKTYLSPGRYIRFMYENPNFMTEANQYLNLYAGSYLQNAGIIEEPSGISAIEDIFAGGLRAVPFSHHTRLYLDTNYVNSGLVTSLNERRYLFISNLFLTTDIVSIVRFTQNGVTSSSGISVSIKTCEITKGGGNLSQRVIRFNGAGSGAIFPKGIFELLIERPSLYDPLVSERVF